MDTYRRFLEIFFRIVRVGIFIAPFIFLFFLASSYFGFFGHLETHYSFTSYRQGNQFIHDIEPEYRIVPPEKDMQTGQVYRRWQKEPVYFRVHMPRLYKKAHVQLTYENIDQDIIEIGLQQGSDVIVSSFELKPLENRFIDNSVWAKTSDQYQKIFLLQKEQYYDSVESFLSDIPLENHIALYNTSLQPDVVLSDYAASPSSLHIDIPIRGQHTFFTYAADEDMDFSFEYQDINRKPGPDDVTVQLFKNNILLTEVTAPDDGDQSASVNVSGRQKLRLHYPQVSPGVYRVVFKVSDDIIVRSIDTAQEKFVISNSVFLAAGADLAQLIPDIGQYSSDMVTDVSSLAFRTAHETGFQDIIIDRDKVSLRSTGTLFGWKAQLDRFESLKDVHIPLGDVNITGSGFFAFTQNSYFDPNAFVSQLAVDTTIDSLDYILYSDYLSPLHKGSLTVASADFDIGKGNIQNDNTLRFILSAPGLDLKSDILIKDIQVTFSREPITFGTFIRKIRSWFANKF